MWKKDETPKAPPQKPSPEPKHSNKSAPPAVAASESFIGSSLIIDHGIRGEGDLMIEGEINVDIELPKNVVTIGPSGRVKAKVNAAIIIVEGKVEGDLVGEEKIEVRGSGHVIGNIVAPGGEVKPGAKIKGNVDMSPNANIQMTKTKPNNAPAKNNAQAANKNSDPKFSGKS